MAGSFQAPAAQVYLRETALKYDTEHVDVLHYEPALQLLLAVRRRGITISNVLSGSQPPQVRLDMRHRHIWQRHIMCVACGKVTISSFFVSDLSSKVCVAALALANLRASEGAHAWTSQLLQEIAITEGPPILAASMSLDGALVTLQRSPVRLEFVSCKNQNIFVQVCLLISHTHRGVRGICSFWLLVTLHVIAASHWGSIACAHS